MDEFKLRTGLGFNSEKSAIIFSGGNSNDNKQEILSILDMHEGALPIKYLGLPLIPSHLSPHHCAPILEKMQSRLNGWSTKCLSYAGRCEVINSTLNSLHVYWSAIFELPSTIVNQIEKTCRRFLWGGSENIKRRSPIAWDQVCRPKTEGGLGIRRVRDWNQAATSQLCFQIISNKNSLWANWVRWKYLKNNSFWSAKTLSKCSWAWRGIMRVCEKMKKHVIQCIGNGRSTNIWFDPWLPNGSLVDQFGVNIISELGRGQNITVDKLMEDGNWKVWPATSPDLILAWKQIEEQSFFQEEEDVIIWKPSASGKFTVKSVWNVLRQPNQNWNFSKIVWDIHNIPKASFCSWLAINAKLKTVDFLLARGICIDNKECVLS